MRHVVNRLRLSWNLGQRIGAAELEFVPPLQGGRGAVPVPGLTADQIGMLAAMAQLPGKLQYDPRTGTIFSEVVPA